MIEQSELVLPPMPKGFHLITDKILANIGKLPETGIINIFLHHTSAGLVISENADPTVRKDLNTIFDDLAPENCPEYTHTLEGADDMPAHIKSALTGVSVTIPILHSKLKLGTWQGIYLCEFRNLGGPRKMTISIFS
ncbi:MAG: YjbQ family protein [Bacteroidales bacterium]|nr:YjbQ family protein [Bacteroidales bacterium]